MENVEKLFLLFAEQNITVQLISLKLGKVRALTYFKKATYALLKKSCPLDSWVSAWLKESPQRVCYMQNT